MRLFCSLFALAFLLPVSAQTDPPPWMEADFPFFSSVLDARKHETNNLTPRGLILKLGAGVFVGFDLDLLRVAAVWQGRGVTPVSMAQVSHYTPGKKAPEGQSDLPQIDGTPLLLNGLYPGIQVAMPNFTDPREPSEDPREVGRGPIPNGSFTAIQLTHSGAQLEYQVNGIRIIDRFAVKNSSLERDVTIGPRDTPLNFILGHALAHLEAPNLKRHENGKYFLGLPPAPKSTRHIVALALEKTDSPAPTNSLLRRWREEIRTGLERVSTNDAFRIEHLALPVENPWRRAVRIADLAFFPDGRAAAVTFDGDVWLVDNLHETPAAWRRFTSGLHEPLSLAIRDNDIFVFDRNGIWRLLDTNNDGEADRHEMFCNRFTQTAETREYANSMKLAPDGSFIVAKGGQTGATIGRDNGAALRVSVDGKTVTTLSTGFRQPFLGVHPKTGVITVTDQQGHYIPTTPIHVIGAVRYHGFRSTTLPPESTAPDVAEPLLWIPHAINPSAMNQVWLSDRGMGSLNNTLIHVGYYRSEVFSVLWNGASTNAAVVSLTRDFDFAALSAAVHPKDGYLYVTGFQIWGGGAPKMSGLARVSHIGGPTALPLEATPFREGIFLRFDQEVDPASVRPDNFSAERWNYQRTANYGSPHFKLDGSKGQDPMFASAAYLSRDGKSVFVAFPEMRPAMQMRLGWSLRSTSGKQIQNNAYMTPRALQPFSPGGHGFEITEINLSPTSAASVQSDTPITVEEGRRLSELMGCVACHSTDGTTLGKVGPTWKGLAGTRRPLTKGPSVLADAEYLRESIRQPTAKIAKDFDKSDTGMPSYEGILHDAQIEALIIYIQSLR